MERLLLQSTNYVYVYHTGGSLNMARFMGMTKHDYESAQGHYNCACWVAVHETLEQALAEINEDFEKDPKYRNTPAGVSLKTAIDCAKEFYRDIVPTYFTDWCKASYIVVVDKVTGYGVSVMGENQDDVLFKINCDDFDMEEFLGKGIPTNANTLLNQTVKYRDVITVREHLTRLYHSECRLSMVFVSMGDKGTVITSFNTSHNGKISPVPNATEWQGRGVVYYY